MNGEGRKEEVPLGGADSKAAAQHQAPRGKLNT